jgi:Raf kinase inhibitor-like YbhB/YbcL family protein
VIGAVVLAVMTLQSADFLAGASIPRPSMSTDCGGGNFTPQLHWSGVPAKTKSFALIVRDPDAPVSGGFFHWVLYDIPGTVRQLDPNALPAGTKTGKASTGRAAYYGPCPPPGPAHRYIFTLYALDVASVAADTPLTAAQLVQRIGDRALAKATLEGVASH